MRKEAYSWENYTEVPEKPVKPRLRVFEGGLPVKIDDETLRDGLQGTQLKKPVTINEKKVYLELAAPYVDHFDAGYPNSHEDQLKECLEIVQHGIRKNIASTFSFAGRAGVWEDLKPIGDIFHKLDGYPIRADIFFDASNRRALIEGWNKAEMFKKIEQNIHTLKKAGVSVMYVGEFATESSPLELEESFERALQAGADVLCIADTPGIATPIAIQNLSRWALENFSKRYPNVQFDAHFHNHLGMAVANTLIATQEGFDEVHVASVWLGEGAGNSNKSDTFLVLSEKGYLLKDKSGFFNYQLEISDLFGVPIPQSAPLIGESANKTGSGIHARTIEKQRKTGEGELIYLPYNPEDYGAKAGAEIGPFSSQANVRVKLSERGIIPTDKMSDEMLVDAKKTGKIHSEASIDRYVRQHRKDLK